MDGSHASQHASDPSTPFGRWVAGSRRGPGSRPIRHRAVVRCSIVMVTLPALRQVRSKATVTTAIIRRPFDCRSTGVRLSKVIKVTVT